MPKWARASATRSRPSSSSSARASSSRWKSNFSATPPPARNGTNSGATPGSTGIASWASGAKKLRLREHDKDELSHYSTGTSDVEYLFPWGWGELEGIAHRGDYDLQQHIKHSGKDLSYFDDESKERYVPHVIEPSAGATRSLLAFLCEAYTEDQAPDDKGKMEIRNVMRFHPRLAPIKAAIFPLVKKDGMPEKAEAICQDLQKHMAVFYDEKGAVGRRYRRQDEVGTPFCITVDGQTLTDNTVTIRERDSMKQDRVNADQVKAYLLDKLFV